MKGGKSDIFWGSGFRSSAAHALTIQVILWSIERLCDGDSKALKGAFWGPPKAPRGLRRLLEDPLNPTKIAAAKTYCQ